VGDPVVVRATAAREGRKTFRGTLETATADGVTIALDEGADVHFAYDDIARANLVHRFDSNGDRQ
jgi:ribosome maturation factor RimP